MATIYLIGCVKKKLTQSAEARKLYISPLFQLSLKYAEARKPDAIYILSAKHGLVELTEKLEPYEQTLLRMDKESISKWGDNVRSQLAVKANLQKDSFIFLAGTRYQNALRPYLIHVHDPLVGLGLGKRLRFLKEGITHV